MSKKTLAPTYELRAKCGDLRLNLADPLATESASEIDLLIYDVIVNDEFWGGVSAKNVAEQLAAARNAGQINVYINSAGGSVFDGIAIYNALSRHKANVDVHIDGMALSSASVVAMAGDRIHIAENAMMMIHNPWCYMAGSAKDLRHEADVLDKIRETIVATYAARSKLSETELPALMDEETWYTAADALAAGLADVITPAKRIAAHADFSRFRNTPAGFLASIEAPRQAPKEPPTMQQRIDKLKAADSEAFETALTDEYGRGHNDGRQQALEETNKPTPAADYMKAFGETAGALFFAKGVSFADAQSQHLANLQTQLAEAHKATADAQEALKAQQAEHAKALQDLQAQLKACRGEETAIDTSNAGRRGDDKRPRSLTDMVKVSK